MFKSLIPAAALAAFGVVVLATTPTLANPNFGKFQQFGGPAKLGPVQGPVVGKVPSGNSGISKDLLDKIGGPGKIGKVPGPIVGKIPGGNGNSGNGNGNANGNGNGPGVNWPNWPKKPHHPHVVIVPAPSTTYYSYAAPVTSVTRSAPAVQTQAAAAPSANTCLSKEYTADGLVVFKDLCTAEMTVAQVSGPQIPGVPAVQAIDVSVPRQQNFAGRTFSDFQASLPK